MTELVPPEDRSGVQPPSTLQAVHFELAAYDWHSLMSLLEKVCTIYGLGIRDIAWRLLPILAKQAGTNLIMPDMPGYKEAFSTPPEPEEKPKRKGLFGRG